MYHVSALGVDERMINLRYSSSSSYLHIMVLRGWGWWPKQPVGVRVFLTCISWCYGDGDQNSQWVLGCFLPAYHGVMGMVTNTASGCWGVSYLHIMVLCGWRWWPNQHSVMDVGSSYTLKQDSDLHYIVSWVVILIHIACVMGGHSYLHSLCHGWSFWSR